MIKWLTISTLKSEITLSIQLATSNGKRASLPLMSRHSDVMN